MRAYADTSFVVKLLSQEEGTLEAAAEYRRLGRPRLFYLPLHALEVENAIYQRVFHATSARPQNERRQVQRERDAALARLAQYLERGALKQVVLDMDSTIERARQLSRAHTERLGARAIDLLHIAAALLLESEVFLTFDQRQADLAKVEGLQVCALYAAE